MKALNRLAIILLMILITVLAIPVISEDTVTKIGPPPGKYKMLTDNGRAEIPFEIYRGDIWFEVSINGHKTHMLLDDGYMWDQLLFWGSPEVDALDLKYDGEIEIGGGVEGEKQLASKTASGITITVGDVEFSEQSAIITPYNSGNSLMWAGSVGQFSASFFKHFIVYINFDNKIVTLIEPDRFEYKGDGVEIPWEKSKFGIWAIPGKMTLDDGRIISLPLAMDLGYNDQLEIKTNGDHTIPVPQHNIPETFGMNISGTPQVGYCGRLPNITIGGYAINDILVNYLFPDPVYKNTYEVMVGLGLLSRFNLIFDIYGQRMIIEPNKSFYDPYEYDMTGLVMRKGDNGYFTVRKVLDGSPASEAGLKVGDKIIKINGKAASEIDRFDLMPIFRQVGKTITLELWQDEKEKKISIKLRRLL